MRESRYKAYPEHPLTKVEQRVLDVAREAMIGAVEWKDVDPDMADPIADAVVTALSEAGYLAPHAYLP